VKVAVIAPTEMLTTHAKRSDYHLVLAHIYETDERYREFYKDCVSKGDFVILDNSAYELGESVNVEKLKRMALDLKPTAMFLPDVRFDREKTLQLVKDALVVLKDVPVKKFAVPQGKDLGDILKCYQELSHLDIDGFGLYEEVGEVAGMKNRPQFLTYLERGGLVDTSKYYHCLGMEENTKVVAEIGKFDWVSGIDSAKPVVYGLYGVAFSEEGPMIPYPHRPEGYFDIKETEFDWIIQWNIEKLLKWANPAQH